jgi:hypothetical protein
VVPALVVIAVVAVATGWWLRDDGSAEPVAISATGPVAASLDDLVAMSDVVVEARVVAVDEGRSITDPADPTAGIRTQLAELELAVVYAGDAVAGESLVVEQESALIDGTPVVVNGLAPLGIDDTGFFFLVSGDDSEFPYHALVGDQGWLPLVADTVRGRSDRDPIGEEWDGRPRAELAATLREG